MKKLKKAELELGIALARKEIKEWQLFLKMLQEQKKKLNLKK